MVASEGEGPLRLIYIMFAHIIYIYLVEWRPHRATVQVQCQARQKRALLQIHLLSCLDTTYSLQNGKVAKFTSKQDNALFIGMQVILIHNYDSILCSTYWIYSIIHDALPLWHAAAEKEGSRKLVDAAAQTSPRSPSPAEVVQAQAQCKQKIA